jgi:hypothetical protein
MSEHLDQAKELIAQLEILTAMLYESMSNADKPGPSANEILTFMEIAYGIDSAINRLTSDVIERFAAYQDKSKGQ